MLFAAGARKPGENLQAEQLSSVSAAKGCGFPLRGNGRFAKHLKICILEIFFFFLFSLLQEEGKRFLGLLSPFLSVF